MSRPADDLPEPGFTGAAAEEDGYDQMGGESDPEEAGELVDPPSPAEPEVAPLHTWPVLTTACLTGGATWLIGPGPRLTLAQC